MKKVLLIGILILFIFSLTSISHAKRIGMYWIQNSWYDQNIINIVRDPANRAILNAFPPFWRTLVLSALNDYFAHRNLFMRFDQSGIFMYQLSRAFQSRGENVISWVNNIAASRTSWASMYRNFNNNVNRHDAIFFAGLGTIAGPFILPLTEVFFAQPYFYRWGPVYQRPGLKWAFFEAGNVLRFPGYYYQCFSQDPLFNLQQRYAGSYSREGYTAHLSTASFLRRRATGLHGIYGFRSINKSLFLPDVPFLSSRYVIVPGFKIWKGFKEWWDWSGRHREDYWEYVPPKRILTYYLDIASMRNLGYILFDYLHSRMTIPWAWSMAHYKLMQKYAHTWSMITGIDPNILYGEHACSISAYGRDYNNLTRNYSGENFARPSPNLRFIEGFWIEEYTWGSPRYL